MFGYILRRLMAGVPMLLGVSIVAFLLLHALPGDPARAILGQQATEENVRQFREAEGLDDPLPEQYLRFMSNALQGDLGNSHYTGKSVLKELKERRVPATIELTVFAMLIAVVVGVSLGVLASVRPRSLFDFVCLGFALIGVSMPIFWLGFLLQKGLAGELGIVPFGERLDMSSWIGFEPTTGFYLYDALFVYQNAELTLDVLHHLALPAMVLATVPMALIARLTRATMLETLSQDFIRTAKAKGLSPTPVVTRHALRNAMIPIITAIGTQFGYLLGGAVLTETIFSWPGVGTYVIEAINMQDAKPLQASVMLVAFIFIGMNLLTDISYAFIDPRMRAGKTKDEKTDGVGWAKFLACLLLALPLVALLLALFLNAIDGSESKLADIAPSPTVFWSIVGVNAFLAIGVFGWMARSGAIKGAINEGIETATDTAIHLKTSAKDFFKFILRHRPALFGLTVVGVIVFVAVFAPWIAPFDAMQGLDVTNAPADATHWMGTDSQGRDLFSRMVFGTRTTLAIAIAATCLSLILGSVIGALAGYFGGAADQFLMRAVDFMMSFPSFLLAVVVVAVLGKSIENLVWAVGIVGAPLFARQMRAEVLRVRTQEYVEAARAMGAGHGRIMMRSVVPNSVSPMIVLGTLGMGSAILDVAGLAFLGLGGDPFEPEWGLILKHGWDQSSQGTFQVGVAGAAIMVTVLGFNLLGDGLRDWLDPRSRRR